jgi:hypothetical protein
MLARECERVKKKSIAVENVIEMLCCRAIGHTGDKEKPRRLAGFCVVDQTAGYSNQAS